ncbi:MAG: AAA family ATPase [Pirellulales bacterium]|nr:AAA family ATPase [Pirellulales bacterium]
MRNSPAPSEAAKAQSGESVAAEVHAPFYQVLKTAMLLGHVLLTGPRGTGKSYAVMQLARERGKQVFVCQGHADLTAEDLVGSPGLVNGSSSFIAGPLYNAVKQGAWFVFEEANLARGGIGALLNRVLDVGGTLAVPFTGEEIVVPESFRALLCVNECGYSACRPLAESLKDRLRAIHCDYWDDQHETEVLRRALHGLSGEQIRGMLTVAKGIREARKKGETNFDFSLRSLLQWGADTQFRTKNLMESFESVVIAKLGDPAEVGLQAEPIREIARFVLQHAASDFIPI